MPHPPRAPRPRRARRLLTLAGAVALMVLGIVPAAFAHVTVNPDTATQGGYAALTFRVPNETDSASTTKVQVFFPQAHPLASASVKPHPGWSYQVKTAKLTPPVKTSSGTISRAVSQIVWTADSPDSAIKPGEFDEFEISVGPLPTVKSLTFKALQTYSDGQVVRWIQEGAPGGAEPEHPAPVLSLVPAVAPTDATGATADPAAGDSGGGTALALSIAALVVALGAAGVAVLRRPRG